MRKDALPLVVGPVIAISLVLGAPSRGGAG
jgi:hypothetical protein